MRLIFLIVLSLVISSIHAEVYKCIGVDGKIIFSDKKECANPEEIKITESESKTGKFIPRKITFNNANEIRKSPHAVKLSFGKEWKYAVFGYYEGFYVIRSDYISIFIDKGQITRTGYGNLEDVDLTSIQFALFTNPDLGSEKENWIYSDIYKIKHNLKISESVLVKNIGFEILTTGYTLDQLSKYKLMGIVESNSKGKKYTSPILSNDYLKVNDSATN